MQIETQPNKLLYLCNENIVLESLPRLHYPHDRSLNCMTQTVREMFQAILITVGKIKDAVAGLVNELAFLFPQLDKSDPHKVLPMPYPRVRKPTPDNFVNIVNNIKYFIVLEKEVRLPQEGVT